MDVIEWDILQEEEEEEEIAEEELRQWQVVALGMLVYVGGEESHWLWAEQCNTHCTYLTRPELLLNPQEESAWQRLYQSQSDRAFITTMGFNIAAFTTILEAGFEEQWNTTPIPCHDVPVTAAPCTNWRSLDAAGALGLVLHFVNSTMQEVSLQQIFALVPATVSRYINFALGMLLDVLKKIPEAAIIWPEGDKFQELNDLVVEHHNLLMGHSEPWMGLTSLFWCLKIRNLRMLPIMGGYTSIL